MNTQNYRSWRPISSQSAWVPQLCLALAAAWLAGLATAPGEAAEAVARLFFVATNGNDQWSGQLAAPNAAASDGPFASLARAREAVRASRQGGRTDTPFFIFLRGGAYFLSEPVVFTPADSGTAAAPLTVAAYPTERPVLSGGRRITGWHSATVNGKDVWQVDLPEVRAGKWFFHQLWMDGLPRPRARHPNHGYLAVAGVPASKPGSAWTDGLSQFRFKAGDLRAGSSLANAEVCVMNRWVESHLPIVSVDESTSLVTFSKRSVFQLEAGDLYYVENALEFLDAPGEWYLDRAAGTLYYLPLPGERADRVEAIAPVLSQVVRIEGRPEAGRFVDHLNFGELTFAHTEWYFPSGFATGKNKPEIDPPARPEVGGFGQAAIGVPAAVAAEGLRHARFSNCQFVHLGDYGLDLGRGCQQDVVSHCTLADLGAGGIRLGETAIRNDDAEVARNNEVSDCDIHDGGRFFHSAIGIWIGQSPANRLVHNEIHDFYYTGISIGWTWGYGKALATNNLVEFNHVHHIGVRSNGDGPILSDMGGIYTLGLHTGTIIRNNLWHDFAGFRYGGWGIYFDEGTTGILAENNLVYRSTHGGFHQHYGKDNVVRNNIFAYGRDQQIQRSRVENHRSFTFEHTLVLWDQGKLFGGNLTDTNYLFRSNLYWHVGGGNIQFEKWNFDQWQQRGQDAGSVIADPAFADPKQGDFTLPPNSPAVQIGFAPFDLRNVGVRMP